MSRVSVNTPFDINLTLLTFPLLKDQELNFRDCWNIQTPKNIVDLMQKVKIGFYSDKGGWFNITSFFRVVLYKEEISLRSVWEMSQRPDERKPSD